MNYSNDSPEIGELFDSFCRDKHKFLKAESVVDDVSRMVDRLTVGHQYLSKKYIAKIDEMEYFQHYRLRQSYAHGIVLCHKKKPPRICLSMCNYIKKPKGIVYYIQEEDDKLLIFSGHFFDRLCERLIEKQYAVEFSREQAIQKTMIMIQVAGIHAQADPLLLDDESFEAIFNFKDGFGFGHHMKFKADPKLFPRNKSGHITVVFFKTFLSDEDITSKKLVSRIMALQKKGQND